MSKNCDLPDYAEYRFTLVQKLLYLLEGSLFVVMTGYFFYQSWIACAGLSAVLLFFFREKCAIIAPVNSHDTEEHPCGKTRCFYSSWARWF